MEGAVCEGAVWRVQCVEGGCSMWRVQCARVQYVRVQCVRVQCGGYSVWRVGAACGECSVLGCSM